MAEGFSSFVVVGRVEATRPGSVTMRDNDGRSYAVLVDIGKSADLAVGDRASVRCRLESERDSYLLHLDAVLRKDVSARHRYSSAQEMEGSGDA